MRRKFFMLIVVVLCMILILTARYSPKFAEFYALNIYPLFSESISFFTSKLNFSLAEVLVAALPALILLYFLYVIIHAAAHKDVIYVKRFINNFISLILTVMLLFVLFCGINYYRYEFTYYSGLEINEVSKDDLVNLCEILINDANEKRALLHDHEGTAKLSDANYSETSKRAKSAIDNISIKYPVLKGSYSAPKQVHFSEVMSAGHITGIFFPFTFESNVNVDIPPYEIPSTMVHELAHLRGFMREDEANFISYLACINSGYDDFYYSGTMLALTNSMNALYYEDYDAFQSLYKTYSDDVLKDIKYSSDYWKHYDTKVAEISNKVNDAYLKANNQKEGVKSYGRMVDLLIAYYNK